MRLLSVALLCACIASCFAYRASVHLGTAQITVISDKAGTFMHPVFEAAYSRTSACALTVNVTSYISSTYRSIFISKAIPRACAMMPTKRIDEGQKYHSTKLCVETLNC